MQSFIDNDLNVADVTFIYETSRDEPWFFENPVYSVSPITDSYMYSIRMIFEGSFFTTRNKKETLEKAPEITLSKAYNTHYKSRFHTLPTRHITISFFTDKKLEIFGDSDEPIKIIPSDPEKLTKLFEKALHLFNSAPLGTKLEQRGIVLQILGIIKKDYLEKNMAKGLSKEFLDTIAKYEIKALKNEDIDINSLAKECNFSYEYFIRLFKKHMGASPKQYFNKIKLDYCASLLRYSHLSIEEVTKIVGYTNLPYFFRSFKNQFGLSPLKYRQLYNNN